MLIYKYLSLIITLISLPVLANDISKLDIEGFKVGDSLLNFYTKSELIKGDFLEYPGSNKFYDLSFVSNKDSQFDSYTFALKKNDNNYKIFTVGGTIYFENKINKCLLHKDKTLQSMKPVLSNYEIYEHEYEYSEIADGKSIAYITDFELSNGFISVYCVEYSKKTKQEYGVRDSFNIDFSSQEHIDWINYEAY